MRTPDDIRESLTRLYWFQLTRPQEVRRQRSRGIAITRLEYMLKKSNVYYGRAA